MSLDVIYGTSRNPVGAHNLEETLSEFLEDGALYLGYPVLATTDEVVVVDALLVSRDHGLFAFILAGQEPNGPINWTEIEDDQDALHAALQVHLLKIPGLRSGRNLSLVIHTATVFPTSPRSAPENEYSKFLGFDGVRDWIESQPEIEPGIEKQIQGAIQRVSTIKPAKRRQNVQHEDSRGATLKRIEQEISNLDTWQKRAAIESPNAPQRIRGLAGSGKNIVLALKGAAVGLGDSFLP